MKIKKYKNVKNVPGPDGSRPKRIALTIRKDGKISDPFWRKRFLEDAIQEIIPEKPKPKSPVVEKGLDK